MSPPPCVLVCCSSCLAYLAHITFVVNPDGGDANLNFETRKPAEWLRGVERLSELPINSFCCSRIYKVTINFCTQGNGKVSSARWQHVKARDEINALDSWTTGLPVEVDEIKIRNDVRSKNSPITCPSKNYTFHWKRARWVGVVTVADGRGKLYAPT